MSDFKALGLKGNTLKGVSRAGYTTPSPIQAAAIPLAVEGRDLIGCAQTGTGKTAAFVLPMLHRLYEMPRPKRGRPVRALVVVPTRELALQVEKATRSYGQFTPFLSLAVFGGTSIDRQIRTLRRGVDIVVATPGRLLDLMDRGAISLSKVGVFILDEADRMFDMGFIKDIRKIAAAVPKQRQTLLFSATMPKAIQELAQSIQTEPEYIQVGQRRNPAKTVDQSVCRVLPNEKIGLLCHVLETEDVDSVIVFSRTKYRADRIVRKLTKKGFSATVMHSNRSQKQREKALAGFRSGRFKVLVATDVAARGIDVDSISHVINYDTP
ncbi:MAG: DEAD/DEAH box helicase, partial [Bacteroidota bacterium]